jgi:hypothetical protein
MSSNTAPPLTFQQQVINLGQPTNNTYIYSQPLPPPHTPQPTTIQVPHTIQDTLSALNKRRVMNFKKII